MTWLDRLLGRAPGAAAVSRVRTTGPPRSSNGASSMHLWWQLPGRFREVSAVLEVVEPPAVAALHFWALQVSFAGGGAAHLGLQSHPGHPGGTAVNWGGYRAGGGELDGTSSALPSAMRNANTRDLGWSPHRRYRLRVSPGELGWRGEVVDLESGEAVVVRELLAPGGHLAGPLVWSEVFARCDDPPSAVRWSELQAVDEGGRVHHPSGLRTSFQTHGDGGCTNGTIVVDGDGVLQRTAVARSVGSGVTLPWPPAPRPPERVDGPGPGEP